MNREKERKEVNFEQKPRQKYFDRKNPALIFWHDIIRRKQLSMKDMPSMGEGGKTYRNN